MNARPFQPLTTDEQIDIAAEAVADLRDRLAANLRAARQLRRQRRELDARLDRELAALEKLLPPHDR